MAWTALPLPSVQRRVDEDAVAVHLASSLQAPITPPSSCVTTIVADRGRQPDCPATVTSPPGPRPVAAQRPDLAILSRVLDQVPAQAALGVLVAPARRRGEMHRATLALRLGRQIFSKNLNGQVRRE